MKGEVKSAKKIEYLYYLCPQGKVLKCAARNQRNRYRVYDIYRARLLDCRQCQVRSSCLSKPDTPRRSLSVEVESHLPDLIEAMKAKIDAPQGRLIYARRLAIVEPVFANIRVHKRLDHFNPFKGQGRCAVEEVVRSGP